MRWRDNFFYFPEKFYPTSKFDSKNLLAEDISDASYIINHELKLSVAMTEISLSLCKHSLCLYMKCVDFQLFQWHHSLNSNDNEMWLGHGFQ